MGPLRQLYRRKYRSLLLLALIVVTFWLLQFFSLRRLNIWSNEQQKHRSIDDLSLIDDQETFENELNQEQKNLKEPQKDMKGLMSGVHSKDVKSYTPDDNGMFTCLQNKVQIPFSQVNDDYCDCDDSTDEPGTNACPYSRFYCKYQLLGEDPVFITGSKVNDGICDCCDGSDEYAQHQVPKNYILDKGITKRLKLYQTPCENKCQQYLGVKVNQKRVQRIGEKLKVKYLEAGRSVTGWSEKYGPKNVFYKLSLTCFTIEKTIYEYKICPFHSVTQIDFPQATFNLGQTPVWERLDEGDYSLWMKNGDSRVCPAGVSRSTKIRFFCGLQDQPLSVTEEDRCLYIVKFSTPAAC